MRGKIGEKWTAIFAACAWALFALSASVASRAVTANAASVDDVITIKATSDYNSEGGLDGEFTWGKIYRGITLLTTASYEAGGEQGSVTISEIDDSTISIGNVDGSPLDERSHEHDFTGGGSWGSTSNGHYAVCSCGIKLEVAHRPSAGNINACADCGYEFVGSGTANTYTFSGIPDHITNTPEEIDSTGEEIVIEFDDEGVATFDITFTAKLFLGSTLTLSLECSGELTAGDASIPYTIEVSCEDTPSNGTLEIGSPSEGGGNLKRIINTI